MAVSQENDIWSVLPAPMFRGVAFPIVSRKVQHSYEHVESGQFRQGAFAQVVGDGAWRVQYEIPMKQGFQTGWKDVLKTTYPQLLAAYEDRSEGTLIDPLLGALTVIPGTWEESANQDTKNGVTVSVEFMKTVRPGEGDTGFNTANLESAVAAMSNEYFNMAATVDWKQEPSPKTKVDPFRQLAGTIERFRAAKQTMNARCGAVISNVNSVFDSLDKAQDDPTVKSMLVSNGRKTRATASRAVNYQASIEGSPKFYVVPRPMTVVSLCKQLAVKLDDLLNSNPDLSKLPTVPVGRKVVVPRNNGK